MKTPNISNQNRKSATGTTAGFPAVARCTNVNTFGILPSPPAGVSGDEASELGFVCLLNH